ncbi:hypothetical protein PAXRUDRAFT_174490, partial [Paxillus rubicundulus Ve08.2h10]
TVCKDFEQIHLHATGNLIKLSHSTLSQIVSGLSMAEAHAENAWLSTSTTKSVIAYVEEVADGGFPFSHWQFYEHVNEILTTCLGSSFPGVGKCWTWHFIMKYWDHLRTSWSAPLDSKWGQAVNPNMNKAWFDLLEAVLDQLSVSEDHIYTDKIQ